MTPPKHIQDVAIINASRGGIAARLEAWGGRRGVAAAPSASVAVVSKRDGRRHIVVLGANKGHHLAVAKLLACGSELQRKFGQRGCPKQRPPAGTRAASVMNHSSGRPAWEAKRPLARYQIAGSAAKRGIAGPADACCRMLTWWGDNRRAHLNDQNGNWTPRSRFTRREVEVGAYFGLATSGSPAEPYTGRRGFSKFAEAG